MNFLVNYYNQKYVQTNKYQIYERDLEEGVMGKGNKNGTILIGSDVPLDMHEEVIEHEQVHVDQVKRGLVMHHEIA